ncbi:PREDICTED: WSC domain-containing protein 2-like [Priapulus caudatus]|uniref:WSC domain-containing protein 2-like n=1 Tax=Priapulus caudatus TaxID=37621 RepID=A0ABM1EKU2_PRICU|nr:PREDICTED: WSC domain-containing protein 2-like [Priapulus caudatus]
MYLGEAVKRHYIGCFNDINGTDIETLIRMHGTLTPTVCAAHCIDRGYIFMGLGHGRNCRCGMAYGKHGQLNETDCNQACPGDGSVMCGAFGVNSVYRINEYDAFSELLFHDSLVSAGNELTRDVTTSPVVGVASVLLCAGHCLELPYCFGFVWIPGSVNNCVLISGMGNPVVYTIPTGGKYYHA